uniref:Uncharacterized protein n=1 Tax=Anguilla anguilla TaxID=7936 RepID=A0A0E9QEN4_ANGAN
MGVVVSCSITTNKLNCCRCFFVNYNIYFFIENAAERSTAEETCKRV